MDVFGGSRSHRWCVGCTSLCTIPAKMSSVEESVDADAADDNVVMGTTVAGKSDSGAGKEEDPLELKDCFACLQSPEVLD